MLMMACSCGRWQVYADDGRFMLTMAGQVHADDGRFMLMMAICADDGRAGSC